MRKIIVERMAKIKRAVPMIENRVKIAVSFGSGVVTIKGNELNEYLVEKIIRAVDFGFDIEDALLLLRDNFVIEFIEVREHTRRKNLRDVRARIIGKGGKAKKTIESLTGSEIVINKNTVGVIVDSNHLDAVIQGIESLIQGAKHGNVFAYLEKQNASMRNSWNDDLGLKGKFKKMADETEDDEVAEL
jgi:ribosomal RNA assembly protein